LTHKIKKFYVRGGHYRLIGKPDWMNLLAERIFICLAASYWAIIVIASSGTCGRHMALAGSKMRQDVV
jgi:hypothetical protein